MRQWAFLLGGLLVWTVHFFGVYIAASLFPGEAAAVRLTAALTLAALVATALVMRAATRRWRSSTDEQAEHWTSGLAVLGCAIAGVAILYQGLPALFG